MSWIDIGLGIISALALVISLYNFFASIIKNRAKIEFSIVDYETYGKTARFFVLIENLSQLPVTISKVTLIIDGERQADCNLKKKTIETFQFMGRSETIDSADFPIHLTVLNSQYAYVDFDKCPDMKLSPGKVLSFQIHSNRLVAKKKITLEQKRNYLRRRNDTQSPQAC